MSGKIIISLAEFENLRKELEEKIKLREEIRIEYKQAQDLGDDRENFPLDAAIAKQRVNERRIQELEGFLAEAEIKDKIEFKGVVDVGLKVTIEKEDGVTREVKLIASEQAIVQYDRNSVTIDSAIGKALLGKKIGDEIIVETPVGMTKYKITKIES